MVKKIIERTEYDVKSDEIKNKSQRFREKIMPVSYGGGQTLDWFADMIDMLEERYGRYWKVMKIAEIELNKDGTVDIVLDCYR